MYERTDRCVFRLLRLWYSGKNADIIQEEKVRYRYLQRLKIEIWRYLHMKKVLVTGADGFIGSHLTESLLEKGYDVKAFTFYNSFNTWGWLDTLPKEKLREIEIFSGDVRDPNGVREAMTGVDAVFHLAALIAIPFSYHSPDSYVDTNIKGTLNVLQAARMLETERVLITST